MNAGAQDPAQQRPAPSEPEPEYAPPGARSGSGSFCVQGIADAQLAELRGLLAEGHGDRFYSWRVWRDRVRPAVLKLDRYECQRCKARGRYARADIVHHVKHLDQRPDLALSLFDPDTGERQLLSVCKSCHEELHPEALAVCQAAEPPVTAERWD